MLVGGAPFSIALPFSQCVVPDGINGPVAIFITSDAQPLNNNIRDQATDKIIAGPTMAFIDTSPEMISSLARGGSAAAPAAPDASTPTPTDAANGSTSSAVFALQALVRGVILGNAFEYTVDFDLSAQEKMILQLIEK